MSNAARNIRGNDPANDNIPDSERVTSQNASQVNPQDRWDLDEFGPEHEFEDIGTLAYGQRIENGRIVGTAADEVQASVHVVLENKVIEGFSNLAKGDHREELVSDQVRVNLSTYSDGIADREGKNMDLSTSLVNLTETVDGKAQRLNIYMFETVQAAEDKDTIANRINQAYSQGLTAGSPNPKLADELKIRIDLEKMSLESDSNNQMSKCFIIRGKNLFDASDTKDLWNPVEIRKGDIVVVLSRQLIDCLDRIHLAEVMEPAIEGNNDIIRMQKLSTLVQDATIDGKFDPEEFDNIVRFWYRSLKKNTFLRSASLVSFEVP